MLLSEIKYQVKRQFGDNVGVQINDADITGWVNNAQREIANVNDDLLQTTASADVLQGISTYDFPDDLRLLKEIQYNSLIMRGMSPQAFSEYIDGYANPSNYSQGNPVVYKIWNRQFTVFPTPSSSATLVAGFTIRYLRNPVPVVNDSDSVEFADGYGNHIIEYCLAMAYELDADWAAAQQKRSQFTQGINGLKERDNYLSRDKYPTISVRPEVLLFDYPYGVGVF